MKAHQLDVFYVRKAGLYVVPSLPSRKGMINLDEEVKVEGGWDGLSAALREGERLALSEAERPAAKRRYGNLEKLIKATGCETFAELVRQDTVICSIIRVPDYVLVTKLLPNTKLNTFEGSHQEQYPADMSIDELARIARRILEAPQGE